MMGRKISGECEKCGEHCLDCKCKWNSWKYPRAKDILNNEIHDPEIL